MKNLSVLALCLSLASATHCGAAEWDLFSDTWVATDALERRLPLAGEVRPPQKDRTVGAFYFVWHGGHGTPGPFDISKLLAVNPENPQYGPKSSFHWWGEPEAGYYRSTDPWVVRRNLSMLQDAGVDVLFLDITNGFTYPDEVRLLGETARAMRAEGNRTPQIGFLSFARPVETVQKLWDEFYSKNLYPELWYRWEGKPLLLGVRDAKQEIKAPDGTTREITLPDEIKNFFNWRYSWAWDAGPGKWQWIDTYPQDPGLGENPNDVEQIPVAIASHPTRNIGRSFHNGKQPPIDRYGLTPTYGQGLHFAEQWKRAHEIDPPLVFVTGWNEWVAQRTLVVPNQDRQFLGKPLPEGGTFFVDAYNAEFNRDAEPMKGGSTDNLYYQLVANIRRYKGARPLPPTSAPQSIRMDADFQEWRQVTPEYRDTVGDTLHRDHPGWGDLRYVNTSGRNDIVSSKVARDAANVYFYADTREPLTSPLNPSWMLLYIDADQNAATGWHGYDFLVNGLVMDANRTTLRRAVRTGENWNWVTVAEVPLRTKDNQLEIQIPRAFLGQTGARVAFDFHWADNARQNGDISEFFLQGDSAPNRRFNYRYEGRQ